jgi:hypothetical protein
MNFYIYSDETEFSLGSNSTKKEIVGSGLLIVESPIDEKIIKNALSNLQVDPDIYSESCESQDTRTLKRKYFHACEDSKNAHSHLCTAIRDEIKGLFKSSYYYLDNSSQSSQSPYSSATRNTKQTLSLELASLQFLNQNRNIHLYVESRESFNINHKSLWLESFFRNRERAIFDSPCIPICFPSIYIEFLDKRNPGLQVTDFLLWAVNRSMSKGDKWLERLNLNRVDESSLLKRESRIEQAIKLYTLGNYLSLKELVEFTSYPVSGDILNDYVNRLSVEEICNLFISIENYIKNLIHDDLPAHIGHLKDDLFFAATLLSREFDFSENVLETIASIYLRIFDTLPVYKNDSFDDERQWLNLLASRKLAALLLRNDLIQRRILADNILTYRRMLFSMASQSLNKFDE